MGESGYWNATNWQLPDYSKQALFSQKSFIFDGIDDYVQIPKFATLDNGDITFSIWWKPESTGTTQYLLSSCYGSPYAGINIGMTNAGKFIFWRFTQTTQNHTGYAVNGFTAFGDWHHLMGVYDATAGTLKSYVNGTLQDTTSDSADTNAVGQDLYIAGLAPTAGSPTLPSAGNVDDLSIFDAAKAIGDIWDGTGAPTDLSAESGLVGYWTFDDATFSTNWSVPDNSTNSNTGTSTNMDEVDLEFNTPGNIIAGLSKNMPESAKVNFAPDNINQGLSIAMDEVDRVADTPP